MPTKVARTLPKRAKLVPVTQDSPKFTSAKDIRAALNNQNQDALATSLKLLRNQLTVRPNEGTLSPQDERLVLVRDWLRADPGTQDVFQLWEGPLQRQYNVAVPLLSVLSSLLTLLTSHYSDHSLGLPIVKALLSRQCLRRLNSYLNGSHNELILVTLKLLNGISTFSGGCEQKSLLDEFTWDAKSLSKLLYMRRKSKDVASINPSERPDIRTLYIMLILSFVSADSHTAVKRAFLEQKRDVFLSIFKGLIQDHYIVVCKVLEVCWSGIWSDVKITRTMKIGLFQESTIAHLTKLYDRVTSEDGDPEHIVADVVHHFLLSICTSPGTGICFADWGWYPRESDDIEVGGRKGGKLYNKVLGNVVKTLKVNEDQRQQELALRILAACPELVASFWAGAALTLEPRLSSKWINNVAFLGSVISFPVPTSSFLLPGSKVDPKISPQSAPHLRPTPPPLSVIIENILPSSAHTKPHFSRGLQQTSPSSSALVQHCTALTLIKCLAKLREVGRAFKAVSKALEENEEGQWARRWAEVRIEARRRVPEIQVVIAFSLQASPNDGASGNEPIASEDKVKRALLAESAQRLLWMYQQCLPEFLAEARFDSGKLLVCFTGEGTEDVNEAKSEDALTEPSDTPVHRLQALRKLHVLRLVKGTDNFSWTGKIASLSTSRSYLHVLLKAYMVSEMRDSIGSLLVHILAQSLPFRLNRNPDEPGLWLSALPNSRRIPDAEAPDEAPLADEGDGVASFLDECVHRYLKSPYGYLDEMHAIAFPASHLGTRTGAWATYPSPLLMTVIEQLEVKMVKKLLSVSDTLAIAVFMRKLLYNLASEYEGLHTLNHVIDRMDKALNPESLFPQYDCMTAAIRRQVFMVRFALRYSPLVPCFGATRAAVQDFLRRVEEVPNPPSKTARVTSAYELVDWLHFVDVPLGTEELTRLTTVVERLYTPAMHDLFEGIPPGYGLKLDHPALTTHLTKHATFATLLLHTSDSEFSNSGFRNILLYSLIRTSPTVTDTKRAIRLVYQRLVSCTDGAAAQEDILVFLAAIMKHGCSSLAVEDATALKYLVFRLPFIVDASMESVASEKYLRGIPALVLSSLEPTNAFDRKIAEPISRSARAAFEKGLQASAPTEPQVLAVIAVWIQFLSPVELFQLLDTLCHDFPNLPSQNLTPLLESILGALSRSGLDNDCLRDRFDVLLLLRPLNPKSQLLEGLICQAMEAFLPMSLDGLSVRAGSSSHPLSHLVVKSRDRWRRLNDSIYKTDIRLFLYQDVWSDTTSKIIAGFLYLQQAARTAFLEWFESANLSSHSTRHTAVVLCALLDSTRCHGSKLSNNAFTAYFIRMLSEVTHPQAPATLQQLCTDCIPLMISVIPHQRDDLLAQLEKHIQALAVNQVTAAHLRIAMRVYGITPGASRSLVIHLVEKSVQLIVRCSTEELRIDSTLIFTNELTKLVELISDFPSHLVDTLLAAITQNCLDEEAALRLGDTVVRKALLKPLIVNRHLQGIVHHPRFFKSCRVGSQTRNVLICLVQSLFRLHPQNTCQPSHVEPLIRIYGGTVSDSDRRLLSIFQLFESQRKLSIASLLTKWSSHMTILSSNVLDALRSLDPGLVFQTSLVFPEQSRLRRLSSSGNNEQLYDPVFLILLFASVLSVCRPESAHGWVGLFRTNVVCVLIRALSAKNDHVRHLAYCQVVGLWQYIQDAHMHENEQVIWILTLLKDVYPPPSQPIPPRIPSYTSLVLLHALRGVFYPTTFTYPHTSRFLLQRPELDTRDVPLLYSMLRSSSDDWKKEQIWMIRFLADGMVGIDDWTALKRRHTWDLLASFFQSSERDRVIRTCILEVFANLTCNSLVTTSLVLKSCFLSWIKMQLLDLKDEEAVSWVKILENILIVADRARFESLVGPTWRVLICTCLSLILRGAGTTVFTLALVARVTLRLGALPGAPTPGLSALVDDAVALLPRLEESVEVPAALPAPWPPSPAPCLPEPLHWSRSMHAHTHGHGHGPVEDLPTTATTTLRLWGEAVELLWRTAMGPSASAPPAGEGAHQQHPQEQQQQQPQAQPQPLAQKPQQEQGQQQGQQQEQQHQRQQGQGQEQEQELNQKQEQQQEKETEQQQQRKEQTAEPPASAACSVGAWDALTARLLVWRALGGAPDAGAGGVAEWARREAVLRVSR